MVKLRSGKLAVIVILVFVLGIGGTMALNLWYTESSKIPVLIKEGEFAGQYDPGDIRGSYSFSEIEAVFNVPVADLARGFGVELADDLPGFLCKELEEIYAGAAEDKEIGTDSVRLFVATYLRLPHTPEETTALPSFAFSLLKEKAGLTPEEMEALQKYRVEVTPYTGTALAVEEHEEVDRNVKGNTTFGDLKSWGLTNEEIEEILGVKAGAGGVTIRDHLTSYDIEFADIKTKLQELLDKKQE